MTFRPTFRALLGLAVTVGLVVVLVPRQLPRPTDVTDPATEATASALFGLRAVAAGLAGYIAVVLLALLLGSARRLPSFARRLIDHWTGRGVASVIRRMVGASALAAGLLPLSPVVAAASTPPVLTPVDLQARLGGVPSLTPSRSESERPPAPSRVPTTGPHWLTVAPGDSFWSLAEDLTTAWLGRDPTDTEVLPRWLALIDANRDRLVDPGDPDLLLPGQVLRLPDPPPGARTEGLR